MAGSAKEFSRLLTEAIRLIKSHEDKSIAAIQDELGYAIGRAGPTIEHWRKGNLPAYHEQTAALVQALVTRVDLKQAWYRRLLSTAGYPNPEQLLATLSSSLPVAQGAPPTGSAPTEQVLSTQSKQTPTSGEWPILPPERPPQTVTLFGQQRLLIRLKERLTKTHWATITGMPGVGKTALAGALLAWLQWPDEKVFWYTIRGKEGLSDIVWRLTDFLAWHGLADFQRALHSPNPPPTAILLDALLHAIRNQGYLLCFDDFHLLDEQPVVEHLLRTLDAHARQKAVNILLISREMPKFARAREAEVVNGLDQAESAGLLQHQGYPIQPDQIAALHLLTQGNPQLLLLVADLLQHSAEPHTLLTTVIRAAPVENYLLHEVDARISDQERAVMQAVATLGSDAATADLVEAVSTLKQVKQHLTNLVERHLLNREQRGAEVRYHQHAIVRNFYYDTLSRSELRTLHQRAAAHYLTERGDQLQAALHFERANDGQRAVQLLIATPLAQLLRQGRAQAATVLLEKLAADDGRIWHDQRSRIAMCTLRGHIYRLLGLYHRSVELFETALQQSTVPVDRAKLLIELGTSHYARGQFTAAKAFYLQSLALYQAEGVQQGYAELYNGLGWACYRLGQLAEANAHFAHGQPFADQYQQEQLRARIDQGLGLIAYREGRLTDAEQSFVASRRRFADLGESWHEADAVSNLGMIYDDRGEHQRARQLWEEAIALWEPVANINSLITTYCNLGDSYTLTGDHQAATITYSTALQLAEKSDELLMLSYATARLADAQLALDNVEIALTLATRAHEIATTGNYRSELGISCRVLGAIWTRLADRHQAAAYYEQALQLLEETNEKVELAKAQANYQKC